MNKYLETLGYYEPGFLHLRVNTDSDIRDLNQLSSNPKTQKQFSTFLHEYIHFLQDITTTSGLLNGHFFIDFIKDINWTIRNDGKQEFEVPVEITNTNNIKANFKLREIYRGETAGSSLAKYDSFIVDYLVVKDKNGTEFRPPQYRVYYYDLRTRARRSLHFGSTCLKEYVAHTIQKKFLQSVDHPDIPYQIAEQIVTTEYPGFGNDTLIIAALCDACLMCYHPAQMFFNTIERMRSSAFVPNVVSDVYEFAYKDLLFSDQHGSLTVEGLFDLTVKQADEQFYDALQAEVFSSNYNWLKHILTQGQQIRLTTPHFITDLVSSEGILSSTFYEIIGKLGTPFYTNKKEVGAFIPPDQLDILPNQPHQLLVFKQVIDLYHGKQSCSLYDFCKTREDQDITNENCINSPWKRAKEEELCPFGQIWKTWGLTDEVPIKRI